MSIRDTFQRNVDGLHDLLVKFKNDINAGVKQLAETASYGDALAYIEGKITNAIVDVEKRRKNVVEILKTKLKLSFDTANEGIASEWEKAVVDMKSQLEMFANELKSDLGTKFAQIQTPVIEQLLIDMAKKKAFTRVTFEFLSNRLKVPKDKISEIAENLILDGKLEARIDLPTETLTFVEDTIQMSSKPAAPGPPPKPVISSKPSLKKESPQAISLDTPIAEGPQPIDLSLEPSDLDITESPPDSIEISTETVETETIEIESTQPSLPAEPSVPESLEKKEESTEIQPESKVAEEEKEAENIISFFKSSVVELSEQEKEEARKKREEKKRELEARKKQKQQEEAKEKEIKEPEVQKIEEPEIQNIEEPEIQKIEQPEIQKPVLSPAETQEVLKSGSALFTHPESKSGTIPFVPRTESPKTGPIIAPAKPAPSLGFQPAIEKTEPPKSELKAPIATKPVSELVIPIKLKEEPSTLKGVAVVPDKGLKCIFCGKPIKKEDPSVISCPHSCGALGHKDEFIKKGQCPKCKTEVKEIDIAFSELL